MVYHFLLYFTTLIFDLFASIRLAPDEKDLQIALLRQQLRMLERKVKKKPRLSCPEKLMLVALTTHLQRQTQRWQQRLRETVLLFQPDTVLRWHRDLVRKKWTYAAAKNRSVRPRTDAAIEALVLQLARENGWGGGKLHGELKKLAVTIGETTVRNILRRHGMPPAPERQRRTTSWRTFMKHYRHQLLACDFFTVETLRLQTLYIFFFIGVGPRRVHLAGITAHPTAPWVNQQARNVLWQLEKSAIQHAT